MTTTAGILPATARTRARRPWTPWHTALLVLAIAAAALTTWAVWTAAPSEYYASIALSMSKNWQNFFFGAVDPAGTVTLDKIPGSFWIPALFVRAFGYSPWAVVLPNALAAVGAVLLIAVTAKRLLGPVTGILAGAVVATTPILIAVARSNQPETFFVLGLAAVAWASMHALTRRSFGWLLTAGLLIALSFQTYMLEAWAVWPALAAAWLCVRGPFLGKLWRLAVAGALSLSVSVLWIVIVSLIPASSRPYIGSTLGNNAWEMVFGYNGLGRFGSATADASAYRSFTPPFSGSPGVFRLFNEQLAGQIAWLLPTAVAALVVLWMLRYSRPVTVLVTVWLATFAAMFSVVAGMHEFYTAALAVPVALAVALAFGVARRARRTWPQALLLVTAAVTALGIGFSVGGYSVPVSIVQASAAAAAVWMLMVRARRARAACGAGAAGGGTSALRGRLPSGPSLPSLPSLSSGPSLPSRRWRQTATAALAGVALLLTPLVWSVVTIAHPSSINPVAGGVSDTSGFGARGGSLGSSGAGQNGFRAPGGGSGIARGAHDGMPPTQAHGRAPDGTGSGPAQSSTLISYLQAHAGGDRYLAATFGAQSAASLILASGGGSFLPIGGFDGGDAVPTLAGFQQLVADGDLHYVLVSASGGSGGFGGSGTGAGAGGGTAETTLSQIRAWVQAHCTVPPDAPDASLYACAAG